MRNRVTGCSFKNTVNQISFNTLPSLNRRRSCECSDCGFVNKKMLYVTTVLSQFQPYQHLVVKLKEQNEKLQQRKRIKLRNQRHSIQKKTILEMMKTSEIEPKRRNNRHHNTVFFDPQAGTPKLTSSCSIETVETTSKPTQRCSFLFHRYNSLSPKKQFCDKKANKIQTFSQKLKTFYLPVTAPFDSETIMKLELIIDGKEKAVKQVGTYDDYEINLRINKFCEDDKEDAATKEALHPLPTLMQEDDEEDDPTDDENLIHLQQFKNSNSKNAYKHILKFNRRSLINLIDKSQLASTNTVRQSLINGSTPKISLLGSYGGFPINMSPVSYNTLSPNPSMKLLDEKKKRPGLKLCPLAIKPIQQFTLTSINISPSVLSTKNSVTKKKSRNIINVPSKQHKRNITFASLLIKV